MKPLTSLLLCLLCASAWGQSITSRSPDGCNWVTCKSGEGFCTVTAMSCISGGDPSLHQPTHNRIPRCTTPEQSDCWVEDTEPRTMESPGLHHDYTAAELRYWDTIQTAVWIVMSDGSIIRCPFSGTCSLRPPGLPYLPTTEPERTWLADEFVGPYKSWKDLPPWACVSMHSDGWYIAPCRGSAVIEPWHDWSGKLTRDAVVDVYYENAGPSVVIGDYLPPIYKIAPQVKSLQPNP